MQQPQQQQMMQQHGGGGMMPMDMQQQQQQSQQSQQQQQQQPQQPQQQFPPGTYMVTDQHGGPPRMIRSVQMQSLQGGRMVMMQGPPGQPAHLVQMQQHSQQQQQMMQQQQQQQGRPAMMTMGPGGQGTPQQQQQQPGGPGIRPSMNEMELRRMLAMMKPENREHLLKLPEDQRKAWIQKMMKEAQAARNRPGGPGQMQQQFMGSDGGGGSVMTQHHMTGGPPPGSTQQMGDSQFAAQTVVATGPTGGGSMGGPGGYPGQAPSQQQQQQQFMQNQQHQFMQQKSGPMMTGPSPQQHQQQQAAMLQQQQQHAAAAASGGNQPSQLMYRVMEQSPMRPANHTQFVGGGGPRSLPHSGVQIVQQPMMQQQQAYSQFGGPGSAAGVMGGPASSGPPHGLSPGNFVSMGGGGPSSGGGPGSMAPYASPQGVGGPMSSSGPSPGSSAGYVMQDASPGYPTAAAAMHMNMQSKMMGVMEPSPLSAMAASANLESSQQQQQQQMMGGGQAGNVGGPPAMMGGGGQYSAAVASGPGGGGGPMPLNPMDEMRYQEKIRELQVYLDFLKRSLEQQQREGVNPVQSKLQKFINILEGRDRVSYEILLKCEESFKRNKQMQEEGVDNRSRIFQPFLDSIVNAMSKTDKRDAVNLIFKRTFDFPWSNIPESKRIRPYQMHEEMMKAFNESSSSAESEIKKEEPAAKNNKKQSVSMTSSPSRDTAPDQSEDAADEDVKPPLRRSSLVDISSATLQKDQKQHRRQKSRDQQKRRSSLVDQITQNKNQSRGDLTTTFRGGRSRLVDSSSTVDDVIGAKQQKKQQPIVVNVPLAIQREVACLEPRFKITLDKSRDYSTGCTGSGAQSSTNQDEQQKVICLLCDIEDADLPLVPALKLKVPLDYPLNNPKFDLSFDDFGSGSFFDRIKQQADGKFARMGSTYSITAILNNWESTIRQVCAT